MNDRSALVGLKEGGLPFLPQDARVNDAKLDAVIDYAKKVHDWPLLAEAIDAKLKRQGEFVEWWKKPVSVRHGPGGKDSSDKAKRADQRSLVSMEQAEKETQIRHQQVSLWKRRLSDPEKYKG